MSNLGEVIKKRRRAKKQTLVELATRSRVSQSYLTRIEKGERSPSGHVLSKIARPLGFTETELFKLAGYIPSDETDDRLKKLKDEIKMEVAVVLSNLLLRIESL